MYFEIEMKLIENEDILVPEKWTLFMIRDITNIIINQ